jgi:hypothetical protein
MQTEFNCWVWCLHRTYCGSYIARIVVPTSHVLWCLHRTYCGSYIARGVVPTSHVLWFLHRTWCGAYIARGVVPISHYCGAYIARIVVPTSHVLWCLHRTYCGAYIARIFTLWNLRWQFQKAKRKQIRITGFSVTVTVEFGGGFFVGFYTRAWIWEMLHDDSL